MSGLDDLLEERDRAARRAEVAELDGDESAAWRALDEVDDLDVDVARLLGKPLPWLVGERATSTAIPWVGGQP